MIRSLLSTSSIPPRLFLATGGGSRARPFLLATVASQRLILASPLVTSASISTTATISSSSTFNRDPSQQPWWTWMAMFLGGSTLVVNCEDNYDHDDKDDEDNNTMDGDMEVDPYDNLPDEDEPTHCSICLTYRQGPCRPYWRKVERCTKDHEFKKGTPDDEGRTNQGGNDKSDNNGNNNEDDDDDEEQQEPPCLKYMLPWIDCASGYRNLYALIELDTNYTAGIALLEKEATMEACWAPSVEPTIDWTPWQAYVAEHPEWKLPKRQKNQDGKRSSSVSLWKTLDADADPELVDILVSVRAKEGEGIIECAYALDQDGNVLGFSYGTKPSEAAKQAEEEQYEPEEGGEGPVDTIELKIRLLPLRTRHITIAAAYTQPLPKDGTKPTEPESHIFKSRPFSLKKMSKPK